VITVHLWLSSLIRLGRRFSGLTCVRQVQRTMLELLNQLDGFESTSSIKVHMFIRLFFWGVLILRGDRSGADGNESAGYP